MTAEMANFEDLQNGYIARTTAPKAIKFLEHKISRRKRKAIISTLRNHHIKPVYKPKKIKMRVATDYFLTACGVMEIASMTGFIANPASTDLGSAARTILNDLNVRRYYEEFYPTRLAQLFKARLNGQHDTRIGLKSSKATSRMLAFLDIDRRFMEELEDGYLTRSLDSFHINDVTFSDFIDLLKDPDEFVNCILSPDDYEARSSKRVLAKIAKEFLSFTEFCVVLNSFLLLNSDDKLFQSAIWNHYSYWFEIIGEELRANLGKALDKLSKWSPTVPPGGEMLGEVAGYLEKETESPDYLFAMHSLLAASRNALEMLTSQTYAAPIAKLIDEINRPEPDPESQPTAM